jgi:putative methionine-R-sulfoxide reductase with GAF domain
VPSYDGPEQRSGILMTFRDATEDLAREALRRLLVCEKDPDTVIREAIRIVRSVIPCDMATFATYSDDGQLCRVPVVEPKPTWQWGTRWFDVTPEGRAWLESNQTWSDDLAATVRELAPDQETDPVVRAVKQDGLNKILVLPVRGTGGGFRCSLSLLSKDRTYRATDLRALHDLGLVELFLAVQAAMDRQREACIQRLKKELNEAPTTRALAKTLAQGVVRCFGWEYAGVFRIDRKAGEFELFEQVDSTENGKLKVDSNYRQKQSDGMLGHCYRQEKVLVLSRVTTEGAKYDFIKTVNAQESAMTVPLRVNGRIELILDLEASQENAFAGPDKQLAEALVADLRADPGGSLARSNRSFPDGCDRPGSNTRRRRRHDPPRQWSRAGDCRRGTAGCPQDFRRGGGGSAHPRRRRDRRADARRAESRTRHPRSDDGHPATAA